MNLAVIIVVLSALLAGLVATNNVLETAFPQGLEESSLLYPNPATLGEFP